MKKAAPIFLTLSIAFTLCHFASGIGSAQPRRKTPPQVSNKAVASQTRVASFEQFPVGKSQTVDLDADEDSLREMSRRERLEQVRDWLLLTVVTASGLPLADVNQASYDLPVIRHPYMQQLADFEYGEARSRYIGNGTVVALVPAGSREEADLLAQVADRQRTDSGEAPASLVIFDYSINLNNNTAQLVRRETLNARELFTDKYGYYESRVANLAELTEFMARVDDVTFARTGQGFLTLGGRKFKNRPYRGISVENVASIWKSEAKLQAEKEQLSQTKKEIEETFNASWKQVVTAFERRWGLARGSAQVLVTPDTLKQFEQEKAALLKQKKTYEDALDESLMEIEIKQARLNGSGFSLDPTYDFDRFKSFFEDELEPLLRELAATNPSAVSVKDIEAAKRGLAAKDDAPFFRLLGKLSKSGNDDITLLLQQTIEQEFTFQHARYDGELQGTEVGMVLFYTDLLAKLWALDFMESTPSKRVRGFDPITKPVSSIFEQEFTRLSGTRLWFGPLKKGFQLAGADKNTLLLPRTSTRIFSASSNPFEPGKEAEPNAPSSAFIGWWDTHYDEVARYEPQYQRLNEIMKWSLIIGWLNDAQKGNLLGFLADVHVNRSYWFPDWARQNPDLKFQAWDKVGFFPRGYKGSDTEAMPILYSKETALFGKHPWTFSGGVSLANKSLIVKRVPLSPRKPPVNPLLLRANLDLSAAGKAGTLRTFEGTTYKLENAAANNVKLLSTPRAAAKLRSGSSELVGYGKFERVLSHGAGGDEIVVRAGAAEVGRFNVARAENGFRVGFKARGIDTGQSLARQLSSHTEPSRLLAGSPDVEVAIKLASGDRYLVKTQSSSEWMLIGPEKGTRGAQIRVADLASGSRNMSLQVLDAQAARAQLTGGNVLGVQAVEEQSLNALLSVERQIPSGARALEIRRGTQVLRGSFDERTGTAFFSRNTLPLELRNDPARLGQILKGSELREIQAQARSVAGEIRYEIPTAGDLKSALARGDAYLAEGKYGKAVEFLNRTESELGNHWQLKARVGVARLLQGKADEAAAVFKELRANSTTDWAAIYDEINLHIKDKGFKFVARENGEAELQYLLTKNGAVVPVKDVNKLGQGEIIAYVQDGYSVSGSHFDIYTREGMQELISGDYGNIYELPRGPISEFYPTEIYDPVRNVRYRLKGSSGTGSATEEGWSPQVLRNQAVRRQLGVARGYAGGCPDDDDDNDDEDQPCVRVVLIVPQGSSLN